jgi:hypothetical protein
VRVGVIVAVEVGVSVGAVVLVNDGVIEGSIVSVGGWGELVGSV